MVALHGFERGRVPPRASLDGDVLVDERVLNDGTRRISRVLQEAGFALTDITTDVRGDRFSDGVLAIAGLRAVAIWSFPAPARSPAIPAR